MGMYGFDGLGYIRGSGRLLIAMLHAKMKLELGRLLIQCDRGILQRDCSSSATNQRLQNLVTNQAPKRPSRVSLGLQGELGHAWSLTLDVCSPKYETMHPGCFKLLSCCFFVKQSN